MGWNIYYNPCILLKLTLPLLLAIRGHKYDQKLILKQGETSSRLNVQKLLSLESFNGLSSSLGNTKLCCDHLICCSHFPCAINCFCNLANEAYNKIQACNGKFNRKQSNSPHWFWKLQEETNLPVTGLTPHRKSS